MNPSKKHAAQSMKPHVTRTILAIATALLAAPGLFMDRVLCCVNDGAAELPPY